MQANKISIAMCTYNGARYLREQLNSIAAQTRLPDELVVCDDCSKDDTVPIIESFASTAPFPVRLYVNSFTHGSTKNFEKAISLTTGDIIALCDQDDVWRFDKLIALESIFTDSVGLVFTNAEIVDECLKPLGYRLWESIYFSRSLQRRVRNDEGFRVLLRYNVVTGATMAFRAAYKDLVLPIPGGWVHDGWIALLIAAAAEVRLIQCPLIKYRQHSGNQIGAVKKGIREWASLFRKIDAKAYFSHMVTQYEEAYDRLSRTSHALRPQAIPMFEEKLKHARARLRLHHVPAAYRTPIAISELLNCRYFRYSNGWKSLVRDLVF